MPACDANVIISQMASVGRLSVKTVCLILGVKKAMYRAVCHFLVNSEWLPVCPTNPLREKSTSYSLNENRMNVDADKKTVVETWNQFTGSLSSALVAYFQARKVRCLTYTRK